jgi:hypothetical protein
VRPRKKPPKARRSWKKPARPSKSSNFEIAKQKNASRHLAAKRFFVL